MQANIFNNKYAAEQMNKQDHYFSLHGYKFIDLFAGIGGMRIPFDEMGAHCVFSSELDKYAVQTYIANHGHKPYGDIRVINETQ